MQLHLFNFTSIVKKKRNAEPSFKKVDKLAETLKKENTLKHIYRFSTLYKIQSYIYFLTINNPLSCLTYYQDDNEFFAELNNTWQLDIKERVLQHLNFIRQIRNGLSFDTSNPTFIFETETVSLFQQSHI